MGSEGHIKITAPLKELLQRKEQDWFPRHGEVKNWEEVAFALSKLKVFEKSVSVKDLNKQLDFLVWKLACDSCSSRPDPPKRPFTLDETFRS